VRDLFGDSTLGLKYYQFINTKLDNIPVIVTRTGWTGELGYELYLLDPAKGVELWNRVLKAGKKYRIAPTGPSDIRRIEAGILNYGIDMTLDNNPYEVGLERLVDLDKTADFIGRDALRRISRERPSKKLVGIEIAGKPMEMNMTRYPVKGGGFVTSCVYSPRLKKNIGYAMLPAKRATEKKLKIEAPGGVRAAVTVTLPFVDPKKEIPKAT
jgi:aminomethyltransferase